MDTTDAVMDLCKRRGYLWPSYEVYGGMAGFYDYGPLGALMKKRFEDLWRHVFQNADVPMMEIACPRVTPHEVLKASGHVDEFTDLVVRCGNGHPHRADHLVEAAGYEGTADALAPEDIDKEVAARRPKCPSCGDKQWSPAEPLNLMNTTTIGLDRDGFLRPETAQGIFTDFPHLLRYQRNRLPFGVLQVGGANRNEISPRQGMLRLREFHMMECEVFFADTDAPMPGFDAVKDRKATFVPSTDESPVSKTFAEAVDSGMVRNQALAYFLSLTQDFLLKAGMDPERLRFRQHLGDEMAHYASDCWDAEFHSERYGWVECVGVADRGCYDLQQHADASGRRSDFEAAVEFPRPFTVHATKHVPDLGVLGRAFKGDAKAIAAAMEAEFDTTVRSVLKEEPDFDDGWLGDSLTIQGPKDATPADRSRTITVDGKEFQVPADGYKILAGEWTVTGRRTLPRVIEPSFGVDRILYALWEHAYEKGEKNGEPYTVLRLSPHVAPVQAAVLPLKSDLDDAAARVAEGLRKAGVLVDFDASGSIGRRYARQDEVGTPVCITIDDQTTEDGTITLRDRDTTKQERVQIVGIMQALADRFTLDSAPSS